jgi:hypothetical protein
MAELVIALFTEAELDSGLQGAEIGTFPFVEHGELESDFVVGVDGEIAGGANEGMLQGIEESHERVPPSVRKKEVRQL